MESNEKIYTISVFTENKAGLVSRLALIFTRRKINIESLTTSESEFQDIYRFTITIVSTAEQVRKIAGQIEKQIDVIKAYYYTDEEVIFQEIALYKVPTEALEKDASIERTIRNHHARILSIEPGFVVIEKTGHEHEIRELFELLKPHGVMGFVRSGRVAVARSMPKLPSYLKELEYGSEQPEKTF